MLCPKRAVSVPHALQGRGSLYEPLAACHNCVAVVEKAGSRAYGQQGASEGVDPRPESGQCLGVRRRRALQCLASRVCHIQATASASNSRRAAASGARRGPRRVLFPATCSSPPSIAQPCGTALCIRLQVRLRRDGLQPPLSPPRHVSRGRANSTLGFLSLGSPLLTTKSGAARRAAPALGKRR